MLLNDEIKVLKKVVWVFEKVVYEGRGDRLQTLQV